MVIATLLAIFQINFGKFESYNKSIILRVDHEFQGDLGIDKSDLVN